MRKHLTRFLGALFITSIAAMPALATQYPPGPGNLCPDSMTVYQIQNSSATCHPSVGDSVYGFGGIVTALDTKTSGVGFYLQTSNGGTDTRWTGIDVFTANTIWPVAIGDSVIVELAKYAVYNLDPEVYALDGTGFGSNFSLRKINSGNPLPPIKTDNATYFQTLPTNPNLSPYLGALVKCTGPLRVVRTTAGTTGATFGLVDNVACPNGSLGPCDSVFVNSTTLPNPSVSAPAIGTIVQSVTGVAGRNTTNFIIRLRLASDLEAALPPNVSDAYSLKDDTVRVVFDRPITQATAENTGNYSLASFGTVNSASLEADGQHVRLGITNAVGHGATETLNINNMVAVSSGLAMTGQQSRTFWNGLTPIHLIRSADPTYLGGSPCVDRSPFAGTGTTPGSYPVTYTGVCTAAFPGGNPIYYIQDASSTMRIGFAQYGPPTALIRGHAYLIAAEVQEFNGETEGVYESYLRDLGPATEPTPLNVTVDAVKDSTCDVSNSILTGQDYLGQLIKLNYVSSQYTNTAGTGFNVQGAGGIADSIHVTHKSGTTWTFVADSAHTVDVTGVVSYSFGVYTVLPRDDNDFVDHGLNVSAPPTKLPSHVEFAVTPNPARTARVAFGLPVKNTVELSVFDLAGRKIVTLANGTFEAGSYSRAWNGLDASGQPAGSGVYFYRLRVGTENYTVRGIKLN